MDRLCGTVPISAHNWTYLYMLPPNVLNHKIYKARVTAHTYTTTTLMLRVPDTRSSSRSAPYPSTAPHHAPASHSLQYS